MAVDDSGNNALTWDGTAWSAPVSIDPGGIAVQLTHVSCADPAFCVAVDGGEVSGNGVKWSLHASFDSNGSQGLMSMSCLSATFCLAADGSGDYLTWNGSKWSSPVMIDLTGDGIESVSCGGLEWQRPLLLMEPPGRCPLSAARPAPPATACRGPRRWWRMQAAGA
jgi:hypothetical protein